jgi:hypothetical protein
MQARPFLVLISLFCHGRLSASMFGENAAIAAVAQAFPGRSVYLAARSQVY